MRLISGLSFCLLLAGCAYDPIDNPGTWRVPPKGLTSNDENLRAMLVNPRDIVVGRGETTSVGVTAGSAVRRVLTNQRKPLPSVATSTAENSGAGEPQSQQSQGASTAPAREE